ncbi:MAG: hypothetical protein GYB42_12315 [Alphaproteobacteria bacterium]|nr:hypothetical protein [Alphaproteobacteria bacterium]
MHAGTGPNWKFHTLVIFRALELIEDLQDTGHENEFSRAEIALAIQESREALTFLIEQFEPSRSTDTMIEKYRANGR